MKQFSLLRMAVFSAAFVPVLFLCSGCATQKTTDSLASAGPSVLEERMLGEKMLKAFQENDSKSFLSLLPSETRKRFSEKEFESARAEITTPLGKIVSYEYLTQLEMPVLHPYIWKVKFQRTGKTEKKIEQEALFRVVVGQLDGKPWILSFGFL